MKARVKATGEILEVQAISDYINENGQIIGEYKDANGMLYNSCDLDFYIEEGITIPDYWTRLEHQVAIAAMRGFLAGGREDTYNRVAEFSIKQAHALVEKLKEKKK